MRPSLHIAEQRGQVLPALLVLLASLLALGVILLQAGDATTLRAGAQSGADAAALAAAKGLREEVQNQLPGSPVSGALARAGADTYAAKNGARVSGFDIQGNDVLVTVETRDTLGEEAGRTNGRPASARARARIDPVSAVGGTNLLGLPASGPSGGGAACASPKEMEEAFKERPSSIVDLGRTLEGLGIAVSEHPSFGGVDPVHSKGSYHYSAAAIDVNAEACGEAATFDRIAPLIEEAGFGVLWRVTDHYDHLHADIGGGGGVGSASGASGHNSYEIRLVAWEGD